MSSVKMEQRIKNALKVLGFEDLSTIPKMKEIRKQWIRLSLLHHPDKPTGETKAFQQLVNAYEIACETAKKNEYDKSDLEEEVARKMHDQSQSMSVMENQQSYTILIEKCMIQYWESVLGLMYGTPKDQKTSGKKFSFKDSCPDGGMIHITLYHTGKILLQAEKNKHSINIHFVNCHLEKLYAQVYRRKPEISVHGLKLPTSVLKQSPLILKSRSKSLSFQCKDPQEFRKCELTVKHNCTFCQEGFGNLTELSKHEKEKHEEFFPKTDSYLPCVWVYRV